jgi:Ni,Fe-hydrogenase III small subunit
MAFPSTPTNGQIAVVGGIAYQYATTPNSWSRIVSTANVITANVITVDTLTANTLNVNNNLYNIAGDISATGNITGNYILGNGSQLTGIATGSISNIVSGTSNITIVSSGGNATVNIGGTADVAVFAVTGEYVTGVVSASGNVTGGNILTGGLISATGALSVTGATTLTTVSTGNISAGNVYSGGSITTGSLISAVGNVTSGNVVTGGLISATGNVSSGASINTVNLSVSGNVLGNLLPSANVTYNLGSPTQRWNTLYLAGNTIELGTQSISATATGVSLGTGDVIGGNVTTTGLVSATGNVTANNGMFTTIVNVASHTGAVVSVTGNVTANNGMFTNIVNVASHTGAVVSVTGNVTGSNLLTGGLISATGSVYGVELWATQSSGDEGGQLNLANPASNSTIAGSSVTIDIYQNRFRIFEQGGTARGAFIDITACGAGVSTNLLAGGGGGTPGGANTNVQFNDGGVFGGTAGLTFNKTTNAVATTGTFSATGNVTANNGMFTNIVNVASHTGAVVSVTGNVTANNGMFTNIVNVASHTGAVVSVTGNITGGNVSGTALTGTLATAAQTNITSVGTLGALAVSGNVTAGNVTAGSGVSVPSGSVLFNGTTQVLTVPDNAVFEMSGDFTIEFWFYITATPVGFDTVLSKGAAGVFQPYYFTFNSSTTLLFYSSSSGTSWDVASAVSMGAVSLNAWNTAAVSRSGTAMRLFLNGALVTTITNGSALYNNANAVGIGGRGDVSELFTGYVSTVRIVKGIGVYTSAYTPATAPLSSTQSANQNGNPSAAITGTSTSLLLNTANGAGFLTDSSTNNFTVTNTGTATSNSLAPFVNTSGTVTATTGIFTTSVNTASFTGTTVSVTGNITAGNLIISGAIQDSAQLDLQTTAGNANIVLTPNGTGNVNISSNLMPTSNATANIGSAALSFNRLFAQATTALYADLAEVYKSDAEYPPGTVLVFGGNQEVTISTQSHDARIAGVVSTNPAHVMNSGLVSEHTVEVGLIGRVPCQVTGPVAAGDRLVSSNQAGVAERLDMQHYQPGVIIGKAVESYNGTGVGTIEVVVGRL